MDAILQTAGVGRRYEHADGPVDALKDVTIDIPEGRFVTITGRSGAGKSTLLLMLGGLIRPTSGTMAYRGQALQTMTDAQLAAYRREHLGFVMQNFNLVPYLSAAQNVMMPLALKRMDRAAQRARADAVLESVGLKTRRNHLPRELSVGQQQRVAIARAFANEPDVILADEPTGNLDPSLSDDILDLLERLNQEQGTTIVMVTHSPRAAERGTMHVRLEDGQIAEVNDEALVAAV